MRYYVLCMDPTDTVHDPRWLNKSPMRRPRELIYERSRRQGRIIPAIDNHAQAVLIADGLNRGVATEYRDHPDQDRHFVVDEAEYHKVWVKRLRWR